MESLRNASRHVVHAALLAVSMSGMSAVAANPVSDAASSAAHGRDFVAQFQASLAESLLVLVPSEAVRPNAPAVADSPGAALTDADADRQVPRSTLLAALLGAENRGLGGSSQVAATGTSQGSALGPDSDGIGQQGIPASPNFPPGNPPRPPRGGPPGGEPPGPPGGGPPGPPNGDPPGPPDGKPPKGPK